MAEVKNNTCKNPNCDFECHKNEEFCILHLKTRNKDWAGFVNTLEKYIEINGMEFRYIHFPENYRFGFQSEKPTSETLYFTCCHFYCELDLSKAVFLSRPQFDSCTFERDVYLTQCVFNKGMLIRGSHFLGGALFNGSKFKEKAFVYLSEFKFGADFLNVSFGTDFEFHTCKIGRSFFLNSNIEAVKFSTCEWEKNYILAEEQYQKPVKIKKLNNIGLPETYGKRILVALSNKNCLFQFIFEKILYLVYKKEYKRQFELSEKSLNAIYIEHTGWNDGKMAEQSYRELRKNYLKQGEADVAGEFFFREKSMQRMQKKWCKRILHYWINERLFGYGEKIWRLICNSVLLILIYSCLYYKVGIYNDASGEIVKEIGQSIYFSIVTFTTLGYGDFNPTGWIKFVAASEALFGAILIALFVVTLTRRLLR